MTDPQGPGPLTTLQHPVELLQQLVRFDTTNPPGNEAACVSYVNDLLVAAGFKTQILASDEARPNLVTRLPGAGQAPPLLMHGHLDVVTTHNQAWTYPPFDGAVADGFVWGRGTLDMKGPVAITLSALLQAKARGLHPAGDIILALVSDEEAGSEYGSRFLVEHHAGLFEGVRYAIGEGGGFTYHFSGRKYYPIMIAEKQACCLTATFRGQGGHGALPVRGQAMAQLARALQRLDRNRLPVHITPVTRAMIEGLTAVLPLTQRLVLRRLLNPRLTDRLLDFLGPLGTNLDPLLHNSVSPTTLSAGDKINVIPDRITLGLDGRLLPGFAPEDLLSELHDLLGDAIALSVDRYDPAPAEPDMGLLDLLAGLLQELDPGAVAGPVLIAGMTDAHQYARLGIQTYGWTPMEMPPGFDYFRLSHAADERVPVDALDFGLRAVSQLLERYGRTI